MLRSIILLSLSVLLTTTVMAQEKKTFELDQLIPGGAGYSALQSENIIGLRWWGDTYLRPSDDTLTAIHPTKGTSERITTVEEVNQILKKNDLPKLHHFYDCSLPTADKKELLVKGDSAYTLVDLDGSSVVWSISLPYQAFNVDFSAKSNKLSYTIDNNLYIASPNEVDKPITTEPVGVVCGQSVHRSEFGIRKGTFWSPKGSLLAFYRMDERMVADYPFVDVSTRIATVRPGKYPMAGCTTHEVSVGVYSPQTDQTIFLQTGELNEHYLTNLSWSPDEKSIYLIELNRDQNHARLMRFNAQTGKREAVLLEEKHDKFVEPEHPITFLPWDQSQFIYQSQKDGFNHLYLYDTTGKLIKQLTAGEWLVQDLLGFDKKGKNLFISSTEASPLETNVYRINVKNGKRTRITAASGIHNLLLSPSGKYAIDRFSTPDLARCIDIIDIEKNKKRTILTAANPFDGYEVPTIETGTIKAADGVTDLYYRLIKPTKFDANKEYPAVVYLYGGPHAQVVTNGWLNGARGWEIYMASQGYVMFSIDNRGSSNRGRDFENATFRQLGVIEAADQVNGVDFLKSLPFVDANRLGIHGWSFGGFMTTNMMLRYPDLFKVGVAGGPVIDWSLYEVMYGERYMDTPESNPDGYNESCLLNKADQLNGHLLLIHGDEDPTCVLQHSLSFMKACVQAGTFPDLFIYPGHGHGVVGKDRVHLNEKITRYLMRELEEKK